MGLLDFSGFVGDETVKDEFGMTQADRRQPLFTGLLKAGMLGMAAGENITPGQRANLMGQVGGAIGDIPEAVNRNRAEAAQMQIRRQQFQTNQQKLQQAKKIQAYAQTPEFAEMMKGLPQHIQFGLKTALEAGDVDHFTRLMGTVEAHRNDRTGIPTGYERDPANPTAIRKIPGWKDSESGALTGNSEAIQHARNLSAAVDSKEYWLAYNYYSTDHKNPDGTITPKLEGIDTRLPKPTYKDPNAPPSEPPKPGDPPGTAAQPKTIDDYIKIGQGLPHGGSTEVNGIEIRKNSVGDVEVEPPDAPMVRVPMGTNEKLRIPQQQVPEKTFETLNKVNIGLVKMDNLEEEMRKKNMDVGSLQTFFLSDKWLNKSNPEGARARAILSGIATQIVHDLSGANVTAPEMKKLEGKIPQATDDPETFKTKLAELRQELEITGRGHLTRLGPGYRVDPEHKRRFRGGGGGAQAAPPAQGGGPKLNEGETNLGPARNGGGFIIQLPNGDKVVRGG